MPPKKKAGSPKKKKGRPTWMTEELYDLTQNLPKLQEFWSGDVKDSKGKAGDKPAPNISRTEAGLYILQLIFPRNKPAKEKREESIKLGIVETSVKVMGSQKPADMVSAAHILAVMADTFDQSRQAMIDSKPAVIPQLLAGLVNQDSAPLKAALCGLLRVLATRDDTRPRLWRQLKEWDWTPLISCLLMQDLSQLGGRNCAHDAMAALDALCSATEGDVGSLCCNCVVNAGGIQAIVHVLRDRVSHPMARAAGVSVLNQIMRRAPASVCEEVMIGAGGLQPIIGLLDLPIVPLVYKAHAAAVLLRFMMPDSLWKNSAALARPKTSISLGGRPSTATPLPPPGEAAGAPPAPPAFVDPGTVATTDAAGLPVRMDSLKLAVSHGIEGPGRPGTTGTISGRPGTGGGFISMEPAVPDDHLLDEATKADIAKRSALVAQAGAIRALVLLCVGTDGPLPDLEAVASAAPVEAAGDAKKKKPKKKKGKKKGKLEPGMAEAQTWASASLRMISMDAEQRFTIVAAGALRYLLPLLEARIHPARWNARQSLINLSMTPALLPVLELYKVPAYIHGANIPAQHFERPFRSTGMVEEELQRIPAHLAGAAAAAQKDISTKAATVTKPPPLKSLTGNSRAVNK